MRPPRAEARDPGLIRAVQPRQPASYSASARTGAMDAGLVLAVQPVASAEPSYRTRERQWIPA
jgi:hypothetical protein